VWSRDIAELLTICHAVDTSVASVKGCLWKLVWQIVNNSAMSLLHTIQQDGTNAPIIMEKVVPSHPVQIRKQKNEIVDLQESAPNAASSPPRSMSEVAAQGAELQVAKPTELKKKNSNRRNKKTVADAAPNAELVTAVDGQTVEVLPVKTEMKEKKTRERKPKKQPLGDMIVEVPQGDEPIQLSPSNDQEKTSSLNSSDEVEEVEAEGTETKQTKGNRRRQRQRMNKKLGKKLQQALLLQQQQPEQQGDQPEVPVERDDSGSNSDGLVTPPPTPSPPAVSQPKTKKTKGSQTTKSKTRTK